MKYLPYALPVLALIGILGYSLWFRNLPQNEGRISGEVDELIEQSATSEMPLLIAVDDAPH